MADVAALVDAREQSFTNAVTLCWRPRSGNCHNEAETLPRHASIRNKDSLDRLQRLLSSIGRRSIGHTVPSSISSHLLPDACFLGRSAFVRKSVWACYLCIFRRKSTIRIKKSIY
jgi:hypothetical protein